MTPKEIKKIRLSLGMTQAKFATALGATIATISRWENGKAVPGRLYIKEIHALVEKTKTGE